MYRTMSLTILFTALLLASVVIILLALIPEYPSRNNDPTPQPAHEDVAIPSDLNTNFLTVSFECSHHDKQWSICLQPEGWGAMFYCPAYSNYDKDELALVEWGKIGVPTPMSPCFHCPTVDSDCSTVVNEVLAAADITQDQNNTLANTNIWDDALKYCKELCESNKEGEPCSQENQCTPGEFFCDYNQDDKEYKDGTCRPCPDDPMECRDEGFAQSVQGQINCHGCALSCYGASVSQLRIDGEAVPSQPIDAAIQSSYKNVSGPLHDCSNLVLDEESTCPGAKGKTCLIYFKDEYAIPWKVSKQADESGCVSVIAFRYQDPEVPMSHANTQLHIPFVYVTKVEGTKLLENKIGVNASVEVSVFGSGCYPTRENRCCEGLPCMDNKFCHFHDTAYGDDWYAEGTCTQCPTDSNGEPNPLACYFDEETLTVQNILSCAASRGAEEKLKDKTTCKFCPTELTEFKFGIEDGSESCYLCPSDDVQYPDRVISLFGENATCRKLDSFFKRLPVSKETTLCQLAQSMNFVCGCAGNGYAGANTHIKKVVLVWLPRVASILSLLGSIFIIADTQRSREKRSKLINKILCCISVFDAIGAIAFSLTTLPIPQDTYILGSQGNEKSCIAQGFFIQIGSIACMLGVSLAIYYNLRIKHNWSESKTKKTGVIYYLLIPPIIIGFAFAAAGINHYENVMVWCNNSAKWWPEIPILLSLFNVTFIMGDVLYSIYKRDKATAQYTAGNMKRFRMAVGQAKWFVGAQFITWIPYLVLQYLLSSGTGYTTYGLTLAATTLAPLQGFWNFIVYARPRYFHAKGLSLIRSGIRSVFRRREKGSSNHDDTSPRKNQPTHRPASSKQRDKNYSNTKTSVTESEVIPFGAPDPTDEPVISPIGSQDLAEKPTTVSFGDPDPINEPDILPPGTTGTANGARHTLAVFTNMFRSNRVANHMNTNRNILQATHARSTGVLDTNVYMNEDDSSGNEDDTSYDTLLAG